MCRNLRILQEIKFYFWRKRTHEWFKAPQYVCCAVVYDVKKCVYGRIGHTNILHIWPPAEELRKWGKLFTEKLGDNRSLSFEFLGKLILIWTRNVCESIWGNLLIVAWGDLIKILPRLPSAYSPSHGPSRLKNYVSITRTHTDSEMMNNKIELIHIIVDI